MKYNILVENSSKFVMTKEIYDDSNGSIDAYLIYLQDRDKNNRSYAAEAIEG